MTIDLGVCVMDGRWFDDAVVAMCWTASGVAVGTAEGRRARWWGGTCQDADPAHEVAVRIVRMRDDVVASVDLHGSLHVGHDVIDDDRYISVDWMGRCLVAVGDLGVHVRDAERPPVVVGIHGVPIVAGPLGPHVLAIGTDRGLTWLDVRLGGIDGHIELPPVVAVVGDPGGRFVVCGDTAGALHVVELATGVGVELGGYPGRVDRVGVLADGSGAVAVADDEITVWPMVDGGVVGSTPRCLRGHGATITALACSPGRALVASGDDDGRVVVRTGDGRETVRVETNATVASLAWAPEGNGLAIGSRDGRAHLVAL
jgi:hypothetical protein